MITKLPSVHPYLLYPGNQAQLMVANNQPWNRPGDVPRPRPREWPPLAGDGGASFRGLPFRALNKGQPSESVEEGIEGQAR